MYFDENAMNLVIRQLETTDGPRDYETFDFPDISGISLIKMKDTEYEKDIYGVLVSTKQGYSKLPFMLFESVSDAINTLNRMNNVEDALDDDLPREDVIEFTIQCLRSNYLHFSKFFEYNLLNFRTDGEKKKDFIEHLVSSVYLSELYTTLGFLPTIPKEEDRIDAGIVFLRRCTYICKQASEEIKKMVKGDTQENLSQTSISSINQSSDKFDDYQFANLSKSIH